MSALTIEGWCKSSDGQKSMPLGEIHFYVDGPLHLRLEEAEERLQKTHEQEAMVDVDMDTMELIMPEEYTPCLTAGCASTCSTAAASSTWWGTEPAMAA